MYQNLNNCYAVFPMYLTMKEAGHAGMVSGQQLNTLVNLNVWIFPAESDYIFCFKRSACFLLISLKQNVSYLLATAGYGIASVLWTSICCVLLYSTLCQLILWGALLLDAFRLLHMHCFTCIHGCLQNWENSFAIYMLNGLNFDWK